MINQFAIWFVKYVKSVCTHRVPAFTFAVNRKTTDNIARAIGDLKGKGSCHKMVQLDVIEKERIELII